MTIKLGDFLNSINFTKVNLLKKDPLGEKDYVPFIINKSMSYFRDTVMIANQVNQMHELPKIAQYQFLMHLVRPRKRFSKWAQKFKNDDADIVAKYYNVNFQRALEYCEILTADQIKRVREEMEEGGIKSR